MLYVSEIQRYFICISMTSGEEIYFKLLHHALYRIGVYLKPWCRCLVFELAGVVHRQWHWKVIGDARLAIENYANRKMRNNCKNRVFNSVVSIMWHCTVESAFVIEMFGITIFLKYKYEIYLLSEYLQKLATSHLQ